MALSVALCAACSDGTAAGPANAPPVMNLSAPLCAVVGEELVFDASATRDEDGRVLALRYLFGDGTPELRTTAPRARHAYLGTGTYEAVVRAFDDDGAEGRATTLVRVFPRRVCVGLEDCDPDQRCEGSLCRPDARDGGVCAPPPCPAADDGGVCVPPSMCPADSQPCGTVTDVCGPLKVCAKGCCIFPV